MKLFKNYFRTIRIFSPTFEKLIIIILFVFFRPIARLASPETSSIGSSVHSHNGGLKPKLPMAATPNSVVAGQQQQQPPKRGQKDETQTNSSSHSSSHQSLAHRAIESFNNKVQSLSSKLPKKAWQEDPTSDDEGKIRSVLQEIHILFSRKNGMGNFSHVKNRLQTNFFPG